MTPLRPGVRAARALGVPGALVSRGNSMPKTAEAGQIQVGGQSFNLRVKPDVFDARDLDYRPKLQMLPPEVSPPPGVPILRQSGNSCTGHALAAVINTALGPGTQASPYMLYALARRYDEYPGTADAGSSLRGALKGWFHHGVVSAQRWPRLRGAWPDLDDDDFRAESAQMPLGAFYRVNPYRLDDMQSAVTELNAVAASAVIHEGWRRPAVLHKGGRTLHVIARPIDGRTLGGHAFAVVGYNEVGFVVQNSWGRAWGAGGLAVLPYEDWLESAYDAWVARPGVRAAKLYVSGWEGGQRGTAGRLLTAPGPEMARLTRYVVNLGNDGLLSTSGRFTSSPGQLAQIMAHLREFRGASTATDVVLFAHGGLVSERDGLVIAQKHLNWWLNNGVYPITLAWQSGPGETLFSQLADSFGARLPAGGLGFDLVEQFDRLVEGAAGRGLKWMWDQMKQNARAAGAPRRRGPPERSPGGTLLLQSLAQLQTQLQGQTGRALRLHLVGHSAGSILLGGLLPRMRELGLRADSLQLLAPAMTLEEFSRVVLPGLDGPAETRLVGRFAVFSMTDADEQDDTVGHGNITPYHKSLLYLVSRALEQPGTEVPLLGMAKFHSRPLLPGGPSGKQALDQVLRDRGSVIVTRGSSTEADALTDARSHGDFDDDKPTMTSVLLRILNKKVVDGHEYVSNSALRSRGAGQGAAAAGAEGAGGQPTAGAAAAHVLTQVRTAQRPASPPPSPVPTAPTVDEVAAPESGRVIIDRMTRDGWTVVAGPADQGGEA